MWKKLKEFWNFLVWVEKLSDEALKKGFDPDTSLKSLKNIVPERKNYRHNLRDKTGRFISVNEYFKKVDILFAKNKIKKENRRCNYFGVYRDEIF